MCQGPEAVAYKVAFSYVLRPLFSTANPYPNRTGATRGSGAVPCGASVGPRCGTPHPSLFAATLRTVADPTPDAPHDRVPCQGPLRTRPRSGPHVHLHPFLA